MKERKQETNTIRRCLDCRNVTMNVELCGDCIGELAKEGSMRFDPVGVNYHKGVQVWHVDQGVWRFRCTKCQKVSQLISSPKQAPIVAEDHAKICTGKERSDAEVPD